MTEVETKTTARRIYIDLHGGRRLEVGIPLDAEVSTRAYATGEGDFVRTTELRIDSPVGELAMFTGVVGFRDSSLTVTQEATND